MLSESEKPEFISQMTLLPWRYSFLVELREFCMLLARGSQSPLVSLYSFTIILVPILKQVSLYSGHWTDRLIVSALSARQGNGCKFFQQSCNVTWYWFYAVCILHLKWPFLNAYFCTESSVYYFIYWVCICPWKAVIGLQSIANQFCLACWNFLPFPKPSCWIADQWSQLGIQYLPDEISEPNSTWLR